MKSQGLSLDGLKRKRRRLLLWSAPVVLLVLLLALKFLSLPVFAGQATKSFAANNVQGTLSAAQGMGTFNMVERYKSYFALGDGYVLRKDFAQAKDSFSTALALVPAGESCKVRVNLVLTLEQLGDAKTKAGDSVKALNFYKEASSVVSAAPKDCFAPQSENNKEGEGEKLDQAKKRLAQKQGSGSEAQDDQGSTSEQTPTEAPTPEQSKLDKLKDKADQAQKNRSNSQSNHEKYAQSSPESYDKPW